MTPSRCDLLTLLDRTRGSLLEGNVGPAMKCLCEGLNEQRRTVSEGNWREQIDEVCRRHELLALLHQDPYTARAWGKPRGYAGDAVMLDFIYSGEPPPETLPLGREVFRQTTGHPNGRSVVARRDHLAALIDEVAAAHAAPRILSVGCGHLREGQQSRALREDRVAELLAFDQDEESLAVVQREQGHRNVRPICQRVRTLLRGEFNVEGMQLIYSAGLYDYLPDASAEQLIRVLFGMLAPGGRLVVCNFVPESPGRGYMEAFMDWFLIYRDEAGLATVADRASITASRRTYRDPYGNIAYLELRK
jgi:SAM-dependent methyltransferase